MHDPYSILSARIASLEARVQELEARNRQPLNVIDGPIIEAITANFGKLHGKLSASQIAAIVGLEASHATLIRLGRHLDTMGVPRTRTMSGRAFVFAEAVRDKPPASAARRPIPGPDFD